MKTRKYLLTGIACILSVPATAQNWNPRSNWKDSYSVDGRCYCDSNGFDHGAADLTYPTPIGTLFIPQICSDIQSALGNGSTNGRVYYNDIQCGNGPPNDAGDEAPDACPGRVDMGPSGCLIIGPKWDLDAVYNTEPQNAPQNPPSTPPVEPTGNQNATASRNSGNANNAIDGNTNTRWTTTQTQRPGQSYTLDLGEVQTVSQVTLDTSNNANDAPAGYNLAVSSDGSSFQSMATGSGGTGITNISFNSQSARYIRITQTGSKSSHWWSIDEISVNSTSTPNTPTNDSEPLDRSGWSIYTSSGNEDVSNAIDNNANTRWTTQQKQTSGQYFEIDLQSTKSFGSIKLDSSGSPADYPRNYVVKVSNNGNNWITVATGTGTTVTAVEFSPQNARYVRIEQNGSSSKYWWSIHEINLYSGNIKLSSDATSLQSAPFTGGGLFGLWPLLMTVLVLVGFRRKS